MKTNTKVVLAGVVNEYLQAYSEAKPYALETTASALWMLEQYFGGEREVSTIASEDARCYREWLACRYGFNDKTIRYLCNKARHFFGWSKRRTGGGANPFSERQQRAFAPNQPLTTESEVGE